MMHNHFEICVSLKGRHYFATHPRSLTDRGDAFKALEDFRERFPEADGFKVTMTYWESVGKDINY